MSDHEVIPEPKGLEEQFDRLSARLVAVSTRASSLRWEKKLPIDHSEVVEALEEEDRIIAELEQLRRKLGLTSIPPYHSSREKFP